ESDHTGPGVVVPQFDQGRIKVGNGQAPASWVRDMLNVTVVTMRNSQEQTLIVISVNLYMIFKNDWELYYAMVRKEVGERFGKLRFIAHSDHNHHGPDTSGTDPFNQINDKWFEYLLRVMTRTTVEALQSEQGCTLDYSERE